MARELINALSGHFECVAELSETEQQLLNDAEPQRLYLAKDAVVFREGEPASHFLLVETGICFNHRHLEDGHRQIIDFFFPNEVIALGELSSDRHSSGLTAFTEAIILAYDKADIRERFSRSPALSQLFIELISQQQANLTERLVGVSRHCARQRVAYFLLEVHARSSSLPEGKRTLIGIPQVLIADALGLSVVHVNRVLRQFREEGLIQTRNQGIEILEPERVKTVAGWLPAHARVTNTGGISC